MESHGINMDIWRTLRRLFVICMQTYETISLILIRKKDNNAGGIFIFPDLIKLVFPEISIQSFAFFYWM
jgi:hypothetical protein